MQVPPVFVGRRLARFARLVANGLAQAVAAVVTTVLIREGFDRFMGTGTATLTEPSWATRSFWTFGAGLVLAAAFTAWLRMRERIDAEALGQDYARDVRLALFRHLGAVSPRALQKRSQGGLFLRFVGDLTALRQWISLGLARLTVAGVATVATLAALAFLNPVLAGIVSLVLAAGAVVSLALGKPMERAVRRVRRDRVRLAATVTDRLSAMAVVQAHGQVAREHRRLKRQSNRLMAAMLERARIVGGLRGVVQITGGLATTGALLIGIREVAAGTATPGMVVAAMTLVGLLVPPLRDLGRVYEYWHAARVSKAKLVSVFNLRPLITDVPGAKRLARGPGRIEFVRVSLSGALRKFSAVAEPGTMVALAGPNGAGKSTVLALAARLLDPERGRVVIDGQNIARVKLASLRRAVGIVSADLPLLRGTIEFNLRYRCPDADEAEIARIRALCGLDDLINRLPKGLRTRLSERGANLSLGERQRLMLARALVGEPRILLLDEADASLDKDALDVLDRALDAFSGTVLMVSHHPERLRRADVVWHLERGRLVDITAAADRSPGLDNVLPLTAPGRRPRP